MNILEKTSAVVDKAKLHRWFHDFYIYVDAISVFTNKDTIIEIPSSIDFSKTKSFSGAFRGCASLKTIPSISSSKPTNCLEMFRGCKSLEEIPQIDTSNASSVAYMFYGCEKLKSIGIIDATNAFTIGHFAYNCKQLTEVTINNTQGCTGFNQAFNGCSELTNIYGVIDGTSASSTSAFSSIFVGCNKLQTVRFAKESIQYAISVPSPVLTAESIQSIIDGLAPVTMTRKLTLSSEVIERLTEKQYASIYDKNWNVG